MAFRVLLLETRHADPEHHRGVEFYPFLLAWCRSRQYEVQWWVCSALDKVVLQGQVYTLDVRPDSLWALLTALRSWQPDVAVLFDEPSEDLKAAWFEVSPRTRFAILKGRISGASTLSEVASWLGVESDENLLLIQSPSLSFDRRFLDQALGCATRDFHRLAVPVDCSYRRRVSRNRFFQPVADKVAGAWGCTFCYLPVLVPDSPVRRADVERDIQGVVHQIVAHQAASPSHVTSFHYWLDQSLASERFPLLLERLVALDLRPISITTLLRPDQLMARHAVLERVLPKMVKRGHRVDVVSVGADNLSATENERFNKGISPSRVLAAFETAKDLARRWPDAFSCEDFSCILFTPWTRLSDIRENITNGLRMGPGFFSGLRGTLLQLWEGTPITTLARHDGAVVDRFEGSLAFVSVSCVPPADVREIPWRFLDPKTRRAHEVLIRLDPLPDRVHVPQDDECLMRIRAARKTLSPALNQDFSRLALALVEAIGLLGPSAPVEDLFDFVRRQRDGTGQRGGAAGVDAPRVAVDTNF